MTITLHWWMLPAVLLVGAIFFWFKAETAGGGCLDGLAEIVVALALTACALAVCVGHWI
jgi:hypothetical protein